MATLREVKEKDNEELLSALYWIASRTTNEVNSRRGLTKQTQKEEQWILNEVIKRFNLDAEKFHEQIDK